MVTILVEPAMVIDTLGTGFVCMSPEFFNSESDAFVSWFNMNKSVIMIHVCHDCVRVYKYQYVF